VGITRPSGDPCSPAGLHFDNVVLGKHTDSSSVPLFDHAATGQVIPKVDIDLDRGGAAGTGGATAKRVLHYQLTNAVVAQVRTDWAGPLPTEEVTLAFTRMCWEFFTQKPDGTQGTSAQACADVTP
jgi:type VI protein secretion system component Hcp